VVFVTGDPAATRILEELAKLPDGAIWEAMAAEGELSEEALRNSSLLAGLLLYVWPKIGTGRIRFLKVGEEFPVKPSGLLQRLLRCELPEATLSRFGDDWRKLSEEGRLLTANKDVFEAVDEALQESGLPAALFGLIHLGSGEQQLVFVGLKNVVAYQHLWEIFRGVAAWVLENKIEIDEFEAV